MNNNISLSRIAGNAGWSLAGQLVPILVAVISVPLLIHYMGIDRFGFLSLAWALVGYAGLFDFGISRAMTRLVSTRLGAGDRTGALVVAKVGTLLMGLFGIVTGILLALFAKTLVHHYLKIPLALQDEAVNGLRILAASLPLVLLTAAYRGVLEAWQAFRPINLIKIVMGLFTYLGPLIAAMSEPRLELIVGSVLLMRLITTYVHAKVCARHCGFNQPWGEFDRSAMKELFTLGGWMSVSNLVSPIMTFLDRFIIGGMVPVKFVAYYSTPYDIITRTLVLPYSAMAVLFPVLSAQSGDADKQQYTYSATIRMLMISMFPICFTAVVLAKPLLTFWLGAEFAEKSTLVLQLLAVGVFANTMAQAPANLIQSSGNPKWMALLHLIELPIFVGMLYMMTTKYGIVGTAACWAGRMVVDAVILYALANHYISSPSLGASWYFVALVCCTVLFVGFWQHSVVISGVFWLSGVTFFVLVAWYILLHSLDRLAIQSLINRLSRGESEFF